MTATAPIDAPATAPPYEGAVAPGLTRDAHHARLTAPARLARLRASGLLDGVASPVLDRLARLATSLLGVPIALVSLVDDRGQHFPGLAGLGGWAGERRGTPLSHSFCQHVVATDRPLLVQDAAHHPLVMENLAFRELGVIAYLGVPLRSSDGETLGAMCAIDTAPAAWTPQQVAVLEDLAAAAVAEIELRATTRELLAAQAQLVAAHERLKAQAVRDPLTGLLNRRGFGEIARQHAALAERQRSSFALLMLDLDGFKAINDRFGHDAGDEALVEMAVLLQGTCRESDVAARLGGDEFVLLLPDTSAADLPAVRARIQEALAAANQRQEREYRLASSIGGASSEPEAREPLAALLRAADAAMYADKDARRAARLSAAA